MGHHPPTPAARHLRHLLWTVDDVLAERRVLPAGPRHRRHRAGRSHELCAPRAHPPPICQRHRAAAARSGEARHAGLHHHHRLLCRTAVRQYRPAARLRTVCSLRHSRHHPVLAHLPAPAAILKDHRILPQFHRPHQQLRLRSEEAPDSRYRDHYGDQHHRLCHWRHPFRCQYA